MRQLFGTDGVRGIAYDFLNAELAKNIGLALGTILKENTAAPKVLIGYENIQGYA